MNWVRKGDVQMNYETAEKNYIKAIRKLIQDHEQDGHFYHPFLSGRKDF